MNVLHNYFDLKLSFANLSYAVLWGCPGPIPFYLVLSTSQAGNKLLLNSFKTEFLLLGRVSQLKNSILCFHTLWKSLIFKYMSQ